MKTLLLIILSTLALYAGPMMDELVKQHPVPMYNEIYNTFTKHYLMHGNDDFFFYVVKDNDQIFTAYSPRGMDWLPEVTVEEYSWYDLTIYLIEIRKIRPHLEGF